MGWDANGIVFLSEPDFEKACGASPGFNARGYRHALAPIWLLDFWQDESHDPFCSQLFDEQTISGEIQFDSSAAEVAVRTELMSVLNSKFIEETQLLNFAATLSNLSAARTFLFAGDDNEFDFACIAESGQITKYRFRCGDTYVDFCDGRITCCQLQMEGVIQIPKTIELGPSINCDEGQPCFESALQIWDLDQIDSDELFGFGSMEPLYEVENEFNVVFESSV